MFSQDSAMVVCSISGLSFNNNDHELCMTDLFRGLRNATNHYLFPVCICETQLRESECVWMNDHSCNLMLGKSAEPNGAFKLQSALYSNKPVRTWICLIRRPLMAMPDSRVMTLHQQYVYTYVHDKMHTAAGIYVHVDVKIFIVNFVAFTSYYRSKKE